MSDQVLITDIRLVKHYFNKGGFLWLVMGTKHYTGRTTEECLFSAHTEEFLNKELAKRGMIRPDHYTIE